MKHGTRVCVQTMIQLIERESVPVLHRRRVPLSWFVCTSPHDCTSPTEPLAGSLWPIELQIEKEVEYQQSVQKNAMYNGMVKPMAITLGKAPMSLLRRARWHTQHNGQQQAYSTTLKGVDRFIHPNKNLSSTDTLWSLLWAADHHWKIISYNVIKKMT